MIEFADFLIFIFVEFLSISDIILLMVERGGIILKKHVLIITFIISAMVLASCSSGNSSPKFTKDNYPRVDGSTATIPLSENRDISSNRTENRNKQTCNFQFGAFPVFLTSYW